MTAFEKALAFTLAQEGGYSDDPRDSGGETNFGISKRSHPDEDIKGMTRERAAEIYKADYWDKCSCGKMPSPVALLLFDAAVNQGPTTAIRLLQKALNLSPDGVVGAQTLGAVQASALKSILPAFAGKRAFQYALHPQFQSFGYGWMRRLAACLLTAMEPF